MHRRAIAVVLAILLACGAPRAWARDVHDWENLQKLKPGTPVQVLLKSGGGLNANFEVASDTSVQVIMLDGSGANDVPRNNVKSITQLYIYPPPGPNAQKWVLVGAGAGAVTGAAIGGARDLSHGSNYRWAEGAFGGALLGMMGSVVVFGGVSIVKAIRFKSEKVVYAAR
jgi:hypothetical protein